jgi:hypothetical protein
VQFLVNKTFVVDHLKPCSDIIISECDGVPYDKKNIPGSKVVMAAPV